MIKTEYNIKKISEDEEYIVEYVCYLFGIALYNGYYAWNGKNESMPFRNYGKAKDVKKKLEQGRYFPKVAEETIRREANLVWKVIAILTFIIVILCLKTIT